jgi:hypothetical protein
VFGGAGCPQGLKPFALDGPDLGALRPLGQAEAPSPKKTLVRRLLVDFHNSRGFDYRRFLLAFREFLGAISVDVDAGEFLAVGVIHGDLPVMMRAPAITLHAAGFFGRFLFQVWWPLGR